MTMLNQNQLLTRQARRAAQADFQHVQMKGCLNSSPKIPTNICQQSLTPWLWLTIQQGVDCSMHDFFSSPSGKISYKQHDKDSYNAIGTSEWENAVGYNSASHFLLCKRWRMWDFWDTCAHLCFSSDYSSDSISVGVKFSLLFGLALKLF